MHSIFNQVTRRIVHTFNPRCASAFLAVVVLVYILIYLIWSSPASFTSRDRNKINPVSSVKTHLTHARHNLLLPKKEYDNINKLLHITPEGSGVWVTDRQIQVMSAYYDMHFNQSDSVRFVMPSFIQHSAERKFVCCFSWLSDPQRYVEIPADIDFIDLRFVTDIQNGAFECRLKGKDNRHPDLVSFAPESCEADVTNPLRINYPEKRTFEFAICTKVAYGRLDPQKLIEWFEYMHEMGASKVITFYTSLHPDSKNVFDYYVSRGLLKLVPYKPREKDGDQPIVYGEETAQSRQARHEKTLTVRDCQYRLAGYDFVLTIDFDEMPVPLRPFSSFHSLFETLMEEYKDASAFRMDPILLPPEWNAVKKTNWLYHWRFHSGTYIAGHCIKWIYIPSRTKVVNTHKVYPKAGFKNYMIPQEYLHFLHFRTCKRERWHEVECDNLTTSITNEMSLKRFAGPISRRIRIMPLEELVPDQVFIQSMQKDRSSFKKENEKR